MNPVILPIISEIEKAIVGKQAVITHILTAMLAHGHILLDDVPGVGKTTLALAISRALGLTFGRVQFTPDVLPSDIVGFSMYHKATDSFEYKPGAAVGVHLLLGDEINRTGAKTQSALLEAMEEGQVTVDGTTHRLQRPFMVIATQNNVGAAGTQLLPYAQLDRFLVKLTIGYPSHASEMDVIRGRQTANPLDSVQTVAQVSDLLHMQQQAAAVHVADAVVDYIARLAQASRTHPLLELGISPRGSLFVNKMAKAHAYVQGRDYVVPQDVQDIFTAVCAHRVLPGPDTRRTADTTPASILAELVRDIPVPDGHV